MRRKRRVTWLPVLGSTEGEDPVLAAAGFYPSAQILDNGASSGQVIPLLFDSPQQPTLSSIEFTTMADFVGSEYILKRLVGKFHIAFGPLPANTTTDSGTAGALVTAGFFVARAADGNTDLPVGFTDLTNFSNYDSDEPNNLMEPWIWRRTWVLGGRRGRTHWTDPDRIAFDEFPQNNAAYGSVADGPHIDAKTGRRIGQDDRLWFTYSVRSLPFGDPIITGTGDFVFGHLDVRALGQIVKAHNRSTF